ncbi:EscU/YscU/HrcU family type III secretion system export apparatus switch protein, partial [Escherichia coli]|uniref:EscU/YscU/HrcU family type III secretion system export apparatus switch protein n=1 Tax=Escherichia coli TaxID=562 RepID=UPI0020239809
MSEKTEKPTPKKLRDLKKKGDVTKSEEVMAAVQSLILFSFFSLYGMSFFVDIVAVSYSHLTLPPNKEGVVSGGCLVSIKKKQRQEQARIRQGEEDRGGV